MKLLDTSSISLFLLEIPRFDCISLLYSSGESLNTTYWVKEEFNQKEIILLEEYIYNNIIHIEDIKSNLEKRYPSLGKGELSIIQWGLYLRENNIPYFCVLDDKKARNIAKRLGLKIKGSIGLIKILKDNNLFDKYQMKEIIIEIDESNFSISESILDILRE